MFTHKKENRREKYSFIGDCFGNLTIYEYVYKINGELEITDNEIDNDGDLMDYEAVRSDSKSQDFLMQDISGVNLDDSNEKDKLSDDGKKKEKIKIKILK